MPLPASASTTTIATNPAKLTMKLEATTRQHEHLARQRDLADQRGVLLHDGGRAHQRFGERVPRPERGEQERHVAGRVGTGHARIQYVHEDERVDGELDQRRDQRPETAGEASGKPVAQFAVDEAQRQRGEWHRGRVLKAEIRRGDSSGKPPEARDASAAPRSGGAHGGSLRAARWGRRCCRAKPDRQAPLCRSACAATQPARGSPRHADCGSRRRAASRPCRRSRP